MIIVTNINRFIASGPNANHPVNSDTEYLDEPKKIFHRSYDKLNIALTLCEGLEIVSANPAAESLLQKLFPQGEDLLINRLISDQSMLDKLFNYKGKPIILSVNNRDLILTANQWEENENFWLLQWDDETELHEISDQLITARRHDAITGALLAREFFRQLESQLPKSEVGLLAFAGCANKRPGADNTDDAIVAIVDRFRHEFGENTLITRYDNDTVALYVPTESTSHEERKHILRQINRTCAKVLAPETPTVALATYPVDGDSVDYLREAALLAFESAKQKKQPVLFTSDLRDSERRRSQLAADMGDALARNEITPHFQPIVSSTTGKIKCFEALVRWFHPELGYIIPPDIIAISQQIGLLEELTAHVLKKTLDQMKHWPDDIQFAVNVTPSQLKDDLVSLVRHSVRDANIDPARLEIEVTEDALIEDFEYAATIFKRLRSVGVGVAMDDFGSGYTSIGNLRKLKFSKIKIDKSISDGLPHDNRSIAILKSLMYMANELEVEITVEGIEEQEQLDFLASFDCGIQGYVFARPMPAEDLPSMKNFCKPLSQSPEPQALTG